ncbi:MAG: exodeoxyribonuclease VII small subunit [Acidimicrobiales bacterium]|nr:exodeoxyribonuclease VII small subunit [Acidimicrobiales bacterium]
MTTDAPHPTADDTPSGYASALAELEQILAELEDDDIDVDVLASRVERAAALVRFCRARLQDAQLKVQEIVADLEDLAANPVAPEGP